MKPLTVGLSENKYDILIGKGLLRDLGGLLKPYVGADHKAVVVTDENVWGYYREPFTYAVREAGILCQEVVLPPGEQNKSIRGLESLYKVFAGANLQRNGLAVALGGGVIGDLCGFAAATYMRGIRYVQVPTSLLAQVDSSVGGKTAINMDQGKNLIGAFYQPKRVVIDLETLSTLPEREWRCGMAEVIKYGAIRSPDLFAKLYKKDQTDDLPDIIRECCEIKSKIVERDERDWGERILLNFGHTFGHAIEKMYNYERYAHGEAVAMGMVIAASIGEEMGVTAPGTTAQLVGLLERHGLNTLWPCPLTELLGFLKADKKSDGDNIKMVFLKKIGEAVSLPVSFSEIGDMVRKVDKV